MSDNLAIVIVAGFIFIYFIASDYLFTRRKERDK